MTTVERKVMAALVRRGHYPETPDGFAQAVVDAQDIVAVVGAGGGEYEVGHAVYWRMHGGSSLADGEFDCYDADQDAVWEALRDG